MDMQKYFNSLSQEQLADLELLANKKINVIDFANKYNLTYKKGGKTLPKATIIDMLANYIEYKNNLKD